MRASPAAAVPALHQHLCKWLVTRPCAICMCVFVPGGTITTIGEVSEIEKDRHCIKCDLQLATTESERVRIGVH
jgi:hypothetical protein